MTETVVLTVSLTAYSLETMAFNNALKSLTFGGTDNIYLLIGLKKLVCGDLVTSLQLKTETFELNQMSLRCYSSLVKMAFFSTVGVLFVLFFKAQLNSFVAVSLHRFDLSNDTGTGFNNSAWNVLSISTEDGRHADFFSNQSWHFY